VHPQLVAIRRQVARRLSWHRRWIAAACAGLAVLSGFSAYDAHRAGIGLIVAAADLPAGRVLAQSDVTTITVPLDAVPDGAARTAGDVLGRRLALPMRRREPLTDVRLLDGPLLRLLGGDARAVPVHVADPAVARLIVAGAVVDVYAGNDAGSAATVVAAGVRVLQVTAAERDGAIVVVAADPTTAARLAVATTSGALAMALRSPP
jgi:Flp pilus assembly protein CpaB